MADLHIGLIRIAPLFATVIVGTVVKGRKKGKIKKKKIAGGASDPLKGYYQLMEQEKLNELEISDGSFQIKLVRQSATSGTPHGPHHVPSAPLGPTAPTEAEDIPGLPVKSPLAGVFFRARSPQSPPFVSEGSLVKLDQPLCIIEAMKVMNEITAKVEGRVIKILVENGKPVEANQTLFIIQPT
ncbi:MAG: acetyl-CoA carboxylase biotin carboxyl carrier protein [Elusimicrobia bacterium]|nr:acetyl-CoA carboxylase biotin carboxyl carrier protein [Candidatus Obscuribacterium magneticum]